jgi:hypothetical protein
VNSGPLRERCSENRLDGLDEVKAELAKSQGRTETATSYDEVGIRFIDGELEEGIPEVWNIRIHRGSEIADHDPHVMRGNGPQIVGVRPMAFPFPPR